MIYGDQKDSDILHYHTDFLIKAVDLVGKSYEGEQASLVQTTYLNLLRRIKCSLMGISAQLNYWPVKGEYKVPISLLFRACITDTLLLLYLKTIEMHPTAFEAEIQLLDKPYVKFVKEFIESGGISPDPVDIDTHLQTLHEAATNAGILDRAWPDFHQKTASNIRGPKQNSPLLINDELYGRELAPKTQQMHLENTPDFANLANAYWLYRYFSQHEHYAPANSRFIHTTQLFDCLQWYKALIIVFEATRLISASLDAPRDFLQDVYDATGNLTVRLAEHYQEAGSSEM